jgi:hypothetical protein
MSDILCNMLNEFYPNIRPDLAEAVFKAISAANNTDEFEDNPAIISSFSQLIISLSFQISESQAINNFMSDNVTRFSASRPFFYHMTLPGLLYPEENPVYPAAPPALPALARSFADHPQIQGPPRIQVPAGFFDAPIRIPDENEAQAPGVVPRLLPNDLEEGEILE